jgi:Protein of unknown function (DUF3800)
MRQFYVDESGFTGEDLLAEDQPIFAQATNDYSAEEADSLIKASFGGVSVAELKYSKLARSGRHYERIVELVRLVADDQSRAGVWMAHKEFALVTFIVDWWMEPLAHLGGLNLYKDGANRGMANMLFFGLQLWPDGFRRRLLMLFQRLFRARTPELFAEAQAFVANASKRANESQADVLRYFSASFPLLGHPHVVGLPPRVLDTALPGLIYIGHVWNDRHPGPWETVHDQSSNMAKQRWLWDAYSSPDLEAARFENSGVASRFPMNVRHTRFGDSALEKQLQICDVLAGACSAFVRIDESDPKQTVYKEKLLQAGIEKLALGGLWPSTEVTAEGLGTKGWDGNLAIEWVAAQLRDKVRPLR